MITIKLTKAELETLAGLMDAGLRATGLRVARQAADLADKLQKAIDEHKKVNKEVRGDE